MISLFVALSIDLGVWAKASTFPACVAFADCYSLRLTLRLPPGAGPRGGAAVPDLTGFTLQGLRGGDRAQEGPGLGGRVPLQVGWGN